MMGKIIGVCMIALTCASCVGYGGYSSPVYGSTYDHYDRSSEHHHDRRDDADRGYRHHDSEHHRHHSRRHDDDHHGDRDD